MHAQGAGPVPGPGASISPDAHAAPCTPLTTAPRDCPATVRGKPAQLTFPLPAASPSAPEEVVLALRPWDLEAEQLPRASLLLFFLLFSDPRPRERLRLLERWREPTGAIAPRSADGEARSNGGSQPADWAPRSSGLLPDSRPGEGMGATPQPPHDPQPPTTRRGRRVRRRGPFKGPPPPGGSTPAQAAPASLGTAATLTRQVRSEPLSKRADPHPRALRLKEGPRGGPFPPQLTTRPGLRTTRSCEEAVAAR